MKTHEPIIDVNPVASARDKARGAKEAAQTVAQATVIGKGGKPAKKPNRVGGAVQTVAGGALMLVGVPMLILPGPGLVAIGGGAALAVGGVKKMIGK